jgi:hypothetical protein
VLERGVCAETPSGDLEEERIRSSIRLTAAGTRCASLSALRVFLHRFIYFLLDLFQGRFSSDII